MVADLRGEEEYNVFYIIEYQVKNYITLWQDILVQNQK